MITNDQGTLLVDTAFLRGSHPTREVTGGCFCCRYDQLVELLAEARRDGAQHVFAEAVGSCADLVATVVRPLLGSTSSPVDRVSFTAMVDARLLIRLQSGEPLPWSGDVAYLFLEQLREAPLLVASKRDLVTEPPSLSASGNGSRIPVPGQTVLLQDGRTPVSVTEWVDVLVDPCHRANAAADAFELVSTTRATARERRRSRGSTPRCGWTQPREVPAKPPGDWYVRSLPKSSTTQTRSATSSS